MIIIFTGEKHSSQKIKVSNTNEILASNSTLTFNNDSHLK